MKKKREGRGKVTFLCMQKCDSTLISFSINGRIKNTKKQKKLVLGGGNEG